MTKTTYTPLGNLSVSNNYTTNGTTGYTFSDTGLSTAYTTIQSTLRVNGDADFDGDITVKGRSITRTLEKIEERLAILPPPNLELERDWSELAKLRRQYVELERKLLEKQRVFNILRKQ